MVVDNLDFWYWFLAPNEMDLDTKVGIMENFSDKKAQDIQSYIKNELNFDIKTSDQSGVFLSQLETRTIYRVVFLSLLRTFFLN